MLTSIFKSKISLLEKEGDLYQNKVNLSFMQSRSLKATDTNPTTVK